nr:MAG TPA: hypothetical protein [Caudoviricetes sp.]
MLPPAFLLLYASCPMKGLQNIRLFLTDWTAE